MFLTRTCDAMPPCQVLRQLVHVVVGLVGHTAEGDTGLLGLDDAGGLAVNEQQVVAGPGGQGELPYCHAQGGVSVEGIAVLQDPAGVPQEPVDLVPGILFRCLQNQRVPVAFRTTEQRSSRRGANPRWPRKGAPLAGPTKCRSLLQNSEPPLVCNLRVYNGEAFSLDLLLQPGANWHEIRNLYT